MISYTIAESGNTKTIKIAGRILEGIGPQVERLEAVSGSSFILDLEGIEGANSVGTTHWYRLMVSLSKKGKIVLQNCSVFFVDYANMTPQLVRGAEFASVFVPLQCTDCTYEDATLLKAAEFNMSDVEAGTCPDCNAPLVLQTPLEDYLRLARKSPAVV